MAQWRLPAELLLWITHLSQPLHARLAWRLPLLMTGMLFAQGRRTVASCTFICDECVTFCAQINVAALGDAGRGLL